MNIVIFMLILTLATISADDKICPGVYQKIGDSQIKWESFKDSVVTSKPSCLNYDNKYLLGMCQNGGWHWGQPPECYSVLPPILDDVCPGNLLSLDEYCAFVTMPQQFEDQCPTGFIKYYNYTKFDPSFAFWSSQRKIHDVFVHTAPDTMYGREFQVPMQRTDCFVVHNGSTLARFCNDSHHQLCVIPKGSILLTTTDSDLRVEVTLKFDRKHSKVLLNVYNPLLILQRLDDITQDAVYCFTNADQMELKTPLKIKQLASTDALRVYQIPIKYEHPGEYWCEVFNQQEEIIKSNTVIAFRKKRGHEYSLRAILKGVCPPSDNCTILEGKKIVHFLDAIKFSAHFPHGELVVRVMKIHSKLGVDVDVILHLTTLRNTHLIREYFMLFGRLHEIRQVDVVWFRSADYCLPETSVIPGLVNVTLNWKLTAMSEEVCPNRLCLNEKALPHMRKCSGSFIEGAFWSDFNQTCDAEVEISPTTSLLYDISMNFEFSLTTVLEVQRLTTDALEIIPFDVYLVAKIMNRLEATGVSPQFQAPSVEILDNLANTIDHLMDVNKTVLMEAQVTLNATDILLDAIDKCFYDDGDTFKLEIRTKVNAGEVYMNIKPNFILHISKPFLSNVHGLALYKSLDDMGFTEEVVRSIDMDHTFDDLGELDELELATFVPVELLETIAAENGDRDNLTVIISIFSNDNLFNSKYEELGTPHGRVVSVKIPDYGLYLNEPLPLLFRREENVETNNTCAYWEYGEFATNKTGHWSNLGGMLEETHPNVSHCYFNHMTHFALLIMSQRLSMPEVEELSEAENSTLATMSYEFVAHDYLLGLITLGGSLLSLAGIVGIFSTAACFPRWRSKTGSKILLQLSLAILLEIVVVHVAGAERLTRSTELCAAVGICLHYVVLAKSSWMFVSAILQYLRFVRIFQVLPSRLILKAMLFAWGLPLLPVGLVAVLMPNYSSAAKRFCYPADLALYLGLFAPVALIILSNVVVFTLIMRSVYSPNVEVKPRTSCRTATSQNRLQIYLGILLFFMLGLPWVFGILAEVLTYPLQLVCVYLFCLTATLQGCVIFLFYVVLDHDTRNLWLKAFERFRSVDYK